MTLQDYTQQLKKLSYTTDNLYTRPCGSQNKFSDLSHTLSKSPGKWSMDQLCKSNTRNKAHGGISNVYYHYPNSLHPNKMNSRNSSVPTSVRIRAFSTEEAITNPSAAAMMDAVHTGQHWWASDSNDLSHSRRERDEETDFGGQRGTWRSIITQNSLGKGSSFLYFYSGSVLGCVIAGSNKLP